MWIGNLGFFSASFSLNSDSVVPLFSVANMLGRFFAGVFMYLTADLLERSRHVLLTGSFMFFSCLCIIKGWFLEKNVFVLLLVAVAYGGNWAILASYVTGAFGKKNMVFSVSCPVLIISFAVKWMAHITGSELDHQYRNMILSTRALGVKNAYREGMINALPSHSGLGYKTKSHDFDGVMDEQYALNNLASSLLQQTSQQTSSLHESPSFLSLPHHRDPIICKPVSVCYGKAAWIATSLCSTAILVGVVTWVLERIVFPAGQMSHPAFEEGGFFYRGDPEEDAEVDSDTKKNELNSMN